VVYVFQGSIFDLTCTDENGDRFVIEIQRTSQADLKKACLSMNQVSDGLPPFIGAAKKRIRPPCGGVCVGRGTDPLFCSHVLAPMPPHDHRMQLVGFQPADVFWKALFPKNK